MLKFLKKYRYRCVCIPGKMYPDFKRMDLETKLRFVADLVARIRRGKKLEE